MFIRVWLLIYDRFSTFISVCCRRTWTTRPPNGEPWRFHRATDKSQVRRQSTPRVWNRLPADLRQLRSTQTFRRHLFIFIRCFLLSSDKHTFMDYVMRRRSTVGGALEMFSLPLPLRICGILRYIFTRQRGPPRFSDNTAALSPTMQQTWRSLSSLSRSCYLLGLLTRLR